MISEFAPNATTAASDRSLMSSPATISLTTDKPPSVCNEPSVVDVASVASSVFNIPPTVVAPEISTAPLISIRVEFNSISSSALISRSPSAGEPMLMAESRNCITIAALSNNPVLCT